MVILLHDAPAAPMWGILEVPEGISTLSDEVGVAPLHQLVGSSHAVLVPPSQTSFVPQSLIPISKSLKSVTPVACVELVNCEPADVGYHAEPLYLRITNAEVVGVPTLSPSTNVNVGL